MVYSTSERAPKKTQNRPFKTRPSTTLMMSSRFPLEKNQKEPVSEVSGMVCPVPLVPLRTALQLTETRKRPSFKHRAVGPETQAADAPTDPTGPVPCTEGPMPRVPRSWTSQPETAEPPGKAAVSATLASF